VKKPITDRQVARLTCFREGVALSTDLRGSGWRRCHNIRTSALTAGRVSANEQTRDNRRNMSAESQPHQQTRHIREIKRYTNRKLYDMLGSCYVTLDEVAEMIRRGQEVHVIDNRTKEDLTHLTLAQIIFETQKDPAQLSPLDALRRIIQATSTPSGLNDDIDHEDLADQGDDLEGDTPTADHKLPSEETKIEAVKQPPMQERIARLERQVLELARLIQSLPRHPGGSSDEPR
jgi:polyhydroxyalkanoate synthesis repressor PhaR